MALDVTDERQRAHAYLDRLPEQQISAVRTLLESMLSSLDRKLAEAPIDDEPLTPEEAAAIEEGIASREHEGSVPLEAVLADLGLTVEDFRKMLETPEKPVQNT